MAQAEMRSDDGGGRQKRQLVDYPSNSRKLREVEAAKPEDRKVESVVTGEVTRRKKTWTSRIFGDVVAEDSGSVIEYLLTDVLIPAFKNLVVDFVTQGVERTVYGDSRPRSAARTGHTNYTARYVSRTGTSADQRQPAARTITTRHEFSDIILAHRSDAEEVLDGMIELVDRYGNVSVSDFYELVGMTNASEFTDNKYGWTDLRGASIQVVRGGYVIRLPRTQALT